MAPKPTKFSIDLANAKQLALRSINQRDPQGLAVGPFEEWVIGFNIKFVEWLVPWLALGFHPYPNPEPDNQTIDHGLNALLISYNAAINAVGFVESNNVNELSLDGLREIYYGPDFERRLNAYYTYLQTNTDQNGHRDPYPLMDYGAQKENDRILLADIVKGESRTRTVLRRWHLELLLEIINMENGTDFQLAFIDQGFIDTMISRRGRQTDMNFRQEIWRRESNLARFATTQHCITPCAVTTGGEAAWQWPDPHRPMIFIWANGAERCAAWYGDPEGEIEEEFDSFEGMARLTEDGYPVMSLEESGEANDDRRAMVQNWSGFGLCIKAAMPDHASFLINDVEVEPQDEESSIIKRGSFVVEWPPPKDMDAKIIAENTLAGFRWVRTMTCESRFAQGWVHEDILRRIDRAGDAPIRVKGEGFELMVKFKVATGPEVRRRGIKHLYAPRHQKVTVKKSMSQAIQESKDPKGEGEGEKEEGKAPMNWDKPEHELNALTKQTSPIPLNEKPLESDGLEEVKFFRAVTFTDKIGDNLDAIGRATMVNALNDNAAHAPALFETELGRWYREDDEWIYSRFGPITQVRSEDGSKQSIRTRHLQRVENAWGLRNRLPIYYPFSEEEGSRKTLNELRDEAKKRKLDPKRYNKAELSRRILEDVEDDQYYLHIREVLYPQESHQYCNTVAFEVGELVRVKDRTRYWSDSGEYQEFWIVRNFENAQGRIPCYREGGTKQECLGRAGKGLERPFGLALSKKRLAAMNIDRDPPRKTTKKLDGETRMKGWEWKVKDRYNWRRR